MLYGSIYITEFCLLKIRREETEHIMFIRKKIHTFIERSKKVSMHVCIFGAIWRMAGHLTVESQRSLVCHRHYLLV